MPTPVFIKRTVLFGDCDPEGIVYTPRFSYFVLEAVQEALGVWLGGPGLRTLLGFRILPRRERSPWNSCIRSPGTTNSRCEWVCRTWGRILSRFQSKDVFRRTWWRSLRV